MLIGGRQRMQGGSATGGMSQQNRRSHAATQPNWRQLLRKLSVLSVCRAVWSGRWDVCALSFRLMRLPSLGRMHLPLLLVLSGMPGPTFAKEPGPSVAPMWTRVRQTEQHMGVDVVITCYAQTEEQAKSAMAAAFAEIARLNNVFTDYDSMSESMRVCREAPVGQPVPVSDDLYALLRLSREMTDATEGKFDVTIGPLTKLWRRCRRRQELPASEDLRGALASSGSRHVTLLENPKRVTLDRRDLQFDFGGVAKGYAAQRAFDVLEEHGCPRSLVAIAGDIVAGEAPPREATEEEERAGWRVDVAPVETKGKPTRTLLLTRRAVSTSGDAFQFVEIAGQRYSHIVDPTTGLGLTDRKAVTVVAPRGDLADVLSTALCLMPDEAGAELLTRYAGSAACVQTPLDAEGLTARLRFLGEFESLTTGAEHAP